LITSSASWRSAPPRASAEPALNSRRSLNAVGVVICAGLLGYAWFAQVSLGLEPCPLCIFQRIGVAVCGVLFLLATLQNPGRVAAPVYGALLVLAAFLTAGVAVRHLWIQHLPEGSVPACGATLNYLLEVFPLTDVIRKVLTGSGECARVTWRFLGLSMPGWVLIAVLGLAALGALANFRSPSSQQVAQR
jgi:disulfide bond formation protein DsbB